MNREIFVIECNNEPLEGLRGPYQSWQRSPKKVYMEMAHAKCGLTNIVKKHWAKGLEFKIVKYVPEEE